MEKLLRKTSECQPLASTHAHMGDCTPHITCAHTQTPNTGKMAEDVSQ